MSSNVKILTITEKQLDMFARKFFSTQNIEVKAETVKPKRNQHAAGDLAHERTSYHIRAIAACSAVRKWMDQRGDSGRVDWAINAVEHFQQHGVAHVVKADRYTKTIMVKAEHHTHGNEPKIHTEIFNLSWDGWLKLMDEMRPISMRLNKKKQRCHHVS